MFKYIFIILGIVILILLIILFVKLAILGKHGLVISEKVEEMQPKIEHIQKQSEEIAAISKSLNEYREKYGPTIKSLLTVVLIYKSYKKNLKKKSSKKAFVKNLRLLTRPNSIDSYKTIINLIKKNV